MATLDNEKQVSTQQAEVIFLSIFQKLTVFKFLLYLQLQKSKEEEIKIIIEYWTRTLNIQFGWINDFDKLITDYANTAFMLDTFRSSSKLLNTLIGHTKYVHSIDYSTFDSGPFICSGSGDKTVSVWDVDNNKQIQSFDGHLDQVFCVKFSQYHYCVNHCNVVCSSSDDNTIRFWDIKSNQQLQIFNGYTDGVCGIEFSSFSGGRYLCSGSGNKTVRLWDVETSRLLHIFNGHEDAVWCVDMSPLQSNNNNIDKGNYIGVIGGNGYTVCSGSWDNTIRIWDIETTKQLIVLEGCESWIESVKYGSNQLVNTILSGSMDKSVRLWDIRSGQQIQVFNGHTDFVRAVEYSPLVVNNNEIGDSSNVICSGSSDHTIRFWDIRSNRNDLYVINGDKEDYGISCLKFMQLKKKGNCNKQKLNDDCSVYLCYGSSNKICVWG
ncbi:WD-repeat protein [Reticulomyxa filosa]|uniref:WD-repeat protein n=1 Tax=Reticulomyxa filosa TaxID=46433 RepID=X6LA82_RETFI|nr:WD-repeat protein [Reticulomyxa filosa]|eukprot:ETN98270.1 WD-repeat protein [Reticulomyxa filosa]